MFGEAKKPIGGHVMAHASTVRIQLKKGRGDERIAKIYDSPDVRDCDILFVLHRHHSDPLLEALAVYSHNSLIICKNVPVLQMPEADATFKIGNGGVLNTDD